MASSWIVEADELSQQLVKITGAEFERGYLTDRLLQYTFRPSNPRAATLVVVVSPHEVIVAAGRGAQFDLDALPGGRDRAIEIARAVAAGGLTERLSLHSVRFELKLTEGRTLKGGNVYLVATQHDLRGSVRYEPY
jgi:hypothetical protein